MRFRKPELGPQIDKSHWPPGVRPIGIAETELIGIDADGLMYWDGKPVQVRRQLDLTQGQAALAWVVAIATVIAAAATVVQAVVAWKGMPA